ncbi:MAG TPA: ectoine/hydroxyectoine ABC transporter substrate-binding protein EhuB [Acidimicrobiia bacterium]|nr:ectoine/hydroxyectoine ABC transporter substrate-binding protein EhuB [Acidimicrobiia bacterium]
MNVNNRGAAWRLLAILAVLAMVVAACGTDDGEGAGDDGDTTAPADGGEGDGLLEELREAGTVTVGVANEVPYGYEDEETGEVTGEAPEIARRVFEELGIAEMNAVVTEFGGLIGGLQAGNFDMIAAGMYINPERAEQVLFTDPDYCVLESMLVPEGNPDGLTNYNSVAETDAVLAVASGTVNVDYAVDAGIPDDQIEEFAGIEDQYDALAAGRVDAVSGTILTVQQHADVMEGFEALPAFPALDAEGNEILGCGGFGFRYENQELRDEFNRVLNELKESGEVADIVEEHLGLRTLAEDAQDLTLEDLVGEG